MKSIKWEDANRCMVGDAGRAIYGDRPNVQELPTNAGMFVLALSTPRGPAIVSCWLISDDELALITRTRKLYLISSGGEVPKANPSIEKPYEIMKPDDPRLARGSM